jgi:hypothetical protein
MARAVNDIVSRDIAWKHMIPFHRKNIWENMYQCSCVTIDFMFRQPRPQYEKCYIAMLRTVYIHVHGKPYPNRTFPVFFWCFDVQITFKFCFCSQWQVYRPTRSTSKLFKCFGQRRCNEVLQGWDKWLRMIKAAMTKKMVKDITISYIAKTRNI